MNTFWHVLTILGVTIGVFDLGVLIPLMRLHAKRRPR